MNTGRPIKEQLTTARTSDDRLTTAQIILGMFAQQLAAHSEYIILTEAAKAKSIKSGKFDATILDRIDGLREGHAKWSGFVSELEVEVTTDPAVDVAVRWATAYRIANGTSFPEAHVKWTAIAADLRVQLDAELALQNEQETP